MSFDEEVRKHGSVSAAMAATGHTKGSNGSWTKKEDSGPAYSRKPSGGGGRTDRDRVNDALHRGEHVGGVYLDPNKLPGGSSYQGGGWSKAEQYEGVTDKTRPQNLGRYDYGGAYDPSKHDAIIHQMEQEAAKGDAANWDTIGALSHGLMTGSGDGVNTAGDGTLTNQVLHDLQQKYHYNADRYYKNKYDSAYGKGAWDDPDFWGKPGQTINPNYAGMTGQGGFQQHSPAGNGYTPGNGEDYIRELFRQRQAEQEALLKAQYEQNLSRLQAHDDLISSTYAGQRNAAAAQNDLQRMQMAELAAAQGLNTGATGQMALGQNMAYQGVLGGLAQQEAQDLANADRAQADLLAQYNYNLAQSNAGLQAQMTDALYNEFVRQQQLAAEAARQAEADRRWQMQWEAEQKAYNDKLAQQQLENDRWQMQWEAEQKAYNDKLALQRAKAAGSRGSGGGSRRGRGSGNSGYDYGGDDSVWYNPNTPTVDLDSVLALGRGPVSPDELNRLEKSGQIISYIENGKIKFRPGSGQLPFMGFGRGL